MAPSLKQALLVVLSSCSSLVTASPTWMAERRDGNETAAAASGFQNSVYFANWYVRRTALTGRY